MIKNTRMMLLGSELRLKIESDADDCIEQSVELSCDHEQSHKDVLNSINIEESIHKLW